MSGISNILNSARNALINQQYAMQVTAHNIANAGNTSYSRERVTMKAGAPVETPVGLLGSGSVIDQVERLKNGYVDQQMRFTNQAMGDSSTRQQIYGQIETLFTEPSDSGLGTSLENFFAAWQDLAVTPESSGARTAVIQKGVQLADTFHRLNSGLAEMKRGLGDDIRVKAARVNELLKQIGSMNRDIAAANSRGTKANDLMDSRDAAVSELSNLMSLTVTERPDGTVLLSTQGIQLDTNSDTDALTVSPNGAQLSITSSLIPNPLTIVGGELGAMLQFYNQDLPAVQAKLDLVASTVVSRVNELHAAGYGLGTPPPTGLNFFDGTSAGSIGVADTLRQNPSNVAASGDEAPGSNTTALALANIIDEQLFNTNTTSVTQFYSRFVSDIGQAVNTADTDLATQTLMSSHLTAQRDATSGVSLDEELTNLISYQRGYQAAAKLVKSVDDMYQTLLGIVPS